MVLLTSSAEHSELVYEAIKAGALGFVTKTSEIGELVTAIRTVAKGQASIAVGSLTSLVTILGSSHLGVEERAESLEEQLSEREEEVLDLVAQGYSNREIALSLCISESTVRSHMHNILDKLQLGNRVQAATYALTARRGRATSLATLREFASTSSAPASRKPTLGHDEPARQGTAVTISKGRVKRTA